MLRVQNLHKSYTTDTGEVNAVSGINIDVRRGEFYTLLGPSGCGKTTTLRCIAGLETPEEGTIEMGSEVVFSSAKGLALPPNKRNIGMVFQSYAIWPHMNVFDNVAFPLVWGRKGLPKAQISERVTRALGLVGLEGLEKRPAPLLSGGQQQRVALARALVGESQVLLLDEPLSNLDAKLREEMRLELVRLIKRLELTTIYVTHDQSEALFMSDRIALLHNGVIVQEGSPQDIYFCPQSVFVASFIGKINILEGKVAEAIEMEPRGVATAVETPVGRLTCAGIKARAKGDRVLVAWRPEVIELHRARPDVLCNALEGKIEAVGFAGDSLEILVRDEEHVFRVRVASSILPKVDESVYIYLPPERSIIIPESLHGLAKTADESRRQGAVPSPIPLPS